MGTIAKARAKKYKSMLPSTRRAALLYKIIEEANRKKISPVLDMDSDLYYQRFRAAQRAKFRMFRRDESGRVINN